MEEERKDKLPRLNTSYQHGFRDIITIRGEAEGRGHHHPPVDIGKIIKEDIGKNKIRRVGGDF